jgi:ATP-dependent helicase HrpA
MREQFAGLIYRGFISAIGASRLPDLIRYLRAMVRRLDKLAGEVRDAERMTVVRRLAGEYRQAVAGLPAQRRADADVVAIRWMLEELRVNLFAQVLGTPAPVSEKRILTALAALTP